MSALSSLTRIRGAIYGTLWDLCASGGHYTWPISGVHVHATCVVAGKVSTIRYFSESIDGTNGTQRTVPLWQWAKIQAVPWGANPSTVYGDWRNLRAIS